MNLEDEVSGNQLEVRVAWSNRTRGILGDPPGSVERVAARSNPCHRELSVTVPYNVRTQSGPQLPHDILDGSVACRPPGVSDATELTLEVVR